MALAADTHVHLYPCYDTGVALRSCARNLAAAAQRTGADSEAVQLVACLTERHDCDAFARLAAGGADLPPDIEVTSTASPEVLRVAVGDVTLYLLAGCQVVTAERIEILALGTAARVEDGAPARDALDTVRTVGAVAVLPWAPGKWWFARGKLVRALLDENNDVLVGDTSLRPLGWGTPILMRHASRRGRGCVAGSDPLPFRGEETTAGRFGSLLEGAFDEADPAASFRAALRGAGAAPRIGRRGSPFSVLRRLRANARAG